MTGLLITVGEILVEIMATTIGAGFREPQSLIGPFPSGAPAIFIDQAARLGASCAIIGAVGDDDFGRVNLDRLSADGVDVSAVAIHPDIATGSAFVRYRSDGSRDFVFNVRHSASGRIALTAEADRIIGKASRIHVMGSALAVPAVRSIVETSVAKVKAAGGSVSFDPNIRKEMMDDAALNAAFRQILEATDLFFPSGEEILLFSPAADEEEAARRLIAQGVREIALKRGGAGAQVHTASATVKRPAFDVVEVDPTGAGDCFGAAYTVCRDKGMPIEQSLAYANAAGARAVTFKGPMEGASTFEELRRVHCKPSFDRMSDAISSLLDRRRAGEIVGIPSICSSHPKVVEATLRRCKIAGAPALIEATCNQVNHEGGYTGMTPADFAAQVKAIAEKIGFDGRNLVLGGDHLGPNPWRALPAEAAMAKSEAMVAAFVAAGFAKIHLDPSMGCAGEPEALDDELTARRAARLARVAEAAAADRGLPAPHYIIGTEVPPPGGARHALDFIDPTPPARAIETLAIFRQAFATAELDRAFARVAALVVQPGVEFGHESVIEYDPDRARPLAHALDGADLVFEAHSTDYQPAARLAELVRDRFCILKVGPALTFALREALYGLDLIASELVPGYPPRALAVAMENLMLAEPRWWAAYYPGEPAEQRVLRHYSYSDRIRYYWPRPQAEAAVRRLHEALLGIVIPAPLLQQFLPQQNLDDRATARTSKGLILAAVDVVLKQYASACDPAN